LVSANFTRLINLAKVIPLGLMLPRKYENNDGDKGFDGIFKLIFGILVLNFKTKLKMEVPCLGD
jgi:hypothetical protein